jgi:CRP/FNR family transcriptional regulator, anaerobic regulatory protein
MQQLPSQEGFEVLEQSVLVTVSYQDLQNLFKAHPTARSIARMLVDGYLFFLNERVRVLQLQAGKEKYRWFRTYHPELQGRVQDSYVASYLGLSVMQLSRIRKADRQRVTN